MMNPVMNKLFFGCKDGQHTCANHQKPTKEQLLTARDTLVKGVQNKTNSFGPWQAYGTSQDQVYFLVQNRQEQGRLLNRLNQIPGFKTQHSFNNIPVKIEESGPIVAQA